MGSKPALSILILSMLLASCAKTKNLSSGNFSKTSTYKLYSYYSGCCGCTAEYFNIYNKGGQLNEQVVYTYNCYSSGMPTKFIFNYDEYGNLIYCSKLIATIEDDVETALTGDERFLFNLINKDKVLIVQQKTIRYSAIKGFRKVKPREIAHAFPLSKRRYTVPIK